MSLFAVLMFTSRSALLTPRLLMFCKRRLRFEDIGLLRLRTLQAVANYYTFGFYCGEMLLIPAIIVDCLGDCRGDKMGD